MVKPFTTKKLKKFDFITEDGRHIHLTKEEINHQKKLEEDAKAEAAKQEGKVRKAKLVDMLGLKVVNKYYNDKLQKDGTSVVIPNFKASDMHLSEWKEVVKDPLDKLNDLTNKKRKHVDDIHDYFKANKSLKSSVQYEDHLPGTVLNKPVLGMIIRHQGPRLDDHTTTFSSIMLAKVDKRNLNLLKQMRVIKQLRQ
ncbi:hypothetical protein Tco_1398363 [Tanacetum coccineum]